MLRSISSDFYEKPLSIITNWGCQQNCWFCIWKHHPLQNINLKTDWNKIEDYLKNYNKINRISISGGGDCLWKYEENKKWWDKLFNLCNKYNILIDIHSRQKFYNDDFWTKINQLVITSDFLHEDKYYFDYILKLCKLRIVHVTTEFTKINEIENFIKYTIDNNSKFTIKQLSIYDDKGMYKKLKEKYKTRVYFLDEGDYNLYFMPNNKFWCSFMKKI